MTRRSDRTTTRLWLMVACATAALLAQPRIAAAQRVPPAPQHADSARRDSLRADSVRARARRGDSTRADSVRAPMLLRDSKRADSVRARALMADSVRATADSLARPGVVPLPAADSVVAVRRRGPRHSVRVCAGGDVTLGTNLDTAWARKARRNLRRWWRRSDDPDSLVAPLRPLLAGADVVLLNVEGAIGAGKTRPKCGRWTEHCYAFRQPPSAARALRRAARPATLVGNVANNHARDAGDIGFGRTLSLLRRAGVLVTGADTLATPVPTAAGDTIGVLGFYTSDDAPDARDLDAVRRHVARAVERWGTVIVTMHLGAEGVDAQRTRDSTELFLDTIDRGNPVAFANAALDGGATMVIGHGPHVLRAAEWRGDRLVLYSLGNLLTYGPFALREPLNRGAVACATIDSSGAVVGARLRPTVQLAPGVLRADASARAAALVDSLSALDFPLTGARVLTDGTLVPRASAAVAPDAAPPR